MKRFFIILMILCSFSLSIVPQTKKKSTSSKAATQSVKSSKSKNNKTQSSTRKKNKSQTRKSEQRNQIPEKIPGSSIPASLFSTEELERQRKNAIEDIRFTESLLNETSKDAKNSLNRLNILSQQLLARKRVVALLNQEIAALDAKINVMQKDLDILDKDLQKTKENYAKSMVNQQQEHKTAQYKMLIILSAENLSQSYRRMRYLREYSDWQKDEAERIKTKQEEIKRQRENLEASRKEKQALLAQREEEDKKLQEEETQQKNEVSQLNKKQKDLQKQLDQKRRVAEALERQIEELISEDIRKSELNKAASIETKMAETKNTPAPKVAENTNKSTTIPAANNEVKKESTYIMTESELHLSKDFASNKGRLPYPVNGRHTVVAKFGEHQHQSLSQVRVNNNGIDIQTTSGTDARAVFKGIITRVFVLPGSNNTVIIRHGDYLTVYSNLSQVYVKAGDMVSTSQALGKIFTDNTNGSSTILHFQIWKERTKLNPESWLRR